MEFPPLFHPENNVEWKWKKINMIKPHDLPKELQLKLLTQITSALLVTGECKDPLTDQSRVVEYAYSFLQEIVDKVYGGG
jgi:hypothetical protein